MSIFSELGIRNGRGRVKEELLYNLASFYALSEKAIERVLAPFGLSSVKMNALLIVKHVGKDKGLSQAEIGKKMVVSAGNITRLLDRLQREDLLKRVAQAGDRRVKLIKITKKGSDLLVKAWPVYKKKVDEIITLPNTDIIKTTSCIEKLRRVISKN